MGRRDAPLRFPTTTVAWNGLSRSLTFMGKDGRTGADVEVSISQECLTSVFPVAGEEVPDLVRSFQEHRQMIETIAALTYGASRPSPLMLDTADVEAALNAIMAVRTPEGRLPESRGAK